MSGLVCNESLLIVECICVWFYNFIEVVWVFCLYFSGLLVLCFAFFPLSPEVSHLSWLLNSRLSFMEDLNRVFVYDQCFVYV